MTDDIKAIRDALAAVTFYPSGTVSYTPEHWLSCCHPERIARLLDALEAAQKDARRWSYARNRAYTDSGTVLLEIASVDSVAVGNFGEYIDAAIDAAMKDAQ